MNLLYFIFLPIFLILIKLLHIFLLENQKVSKVLKRPYFVFHLDLYSGFDKSILLTMFTNLKLSIYKVEGNNWIFERKTDFFKKGYFIMLIFEEDINRLTIEYYPKYRDMRENQSKEIKNKIINPINEILAKQVY